MTDLVAAKRLSLVETSPEVSNQHEFHAGQLRKALQIPEEMTRGPLDIMYALDDDADAESESCSYTVSNVRRDNPDRDEYHMYYSSRRLQQVAKAGDILVLTRSPVGTSIRALIVRPGTTLGSQLEELFADDGVELSTRFKAIRARLSGTAASAFLGAAAEAVAIPSAEAFLRVADDSLVSQALASGVVPGSRIMAEAAGMMVERMSSSRLEPDHLLQWRLDAETALYQHLEEQIGQRQLDELVASGTMAFGDVTQLVMKRLQSRKSRRGLSLQNHFAALLQREQISFDEQCRTEHGERPDFLVPGCAAYNNAAYPSDRLRMVACKSVLRERWDQMLNEAARIAEKYLLTLDLALTDATISDIRRNNVRLFIPSVVADAAYRHHVQRSEIQSVAELINRLRASST